MTPIHKPSQKLSIRNEFNIAYNRLPLPHPWTDESRGGIEGGAKRVVLVKGRAFRLTKGGASSRGWDLG